MIETNKSMLLTAEEIKNDQLKAEKNLKTCQVVLIDLKGIINEWESK